MSDKPVLSEDQRERLEAEEQARYEIRREIKRKHHRPIWMAIAAVLGFVFLLLLAAHIVNQYKHRVGAELVLSETVFTFSSQDTLDKFEAAPSDETASFMPAAIKIPGDTRVRVVKSDSERRCIAAMDGDKQGQEGWIELAWLEGSTK